MNPYLFIRKGQIENVKYCNFLSPIFDLGISVAWCITKGEWWHGDKTNNEPKFFWCSRYNGEVHTGPQFFIGRLAFGFMTKK